MSAYAVTFEKDEIVKKKAQIDAWQAEAEQQLSTAKTAPEMAKARRRIEQIGLLRERLNHFIRDLETSPAKVLEPPPIQLKGLGAEVMEFRPQAAYKGKPARQVSARAVVDEGKKTVHVYSIRLELNEEPLP